MGIDCALLCECSLIGWSIGNIVVCVFETVSSLYAAPTEDINYIIATSHSVCCTVCFLGASHDAYTATIEYSTLAGDDVHYGCEGHVTIE